MSKRVALNGCFDELHPGHLFILGNAYALADGGEVIVGINDQEYIRKHKGRQDGLSNQQRAAALMATGAVDAVHIFREANPVEFIRKVSPDIYCIGEEYRGLASEETLLKDMGAQIRYIPRIGDWASTSIKEGSQ